MADLTRTLNLTDLIALICHYRKESYACERHLALLTFGLWVIEPNDINFVRHGRLIGAAQIVKSMSQVKRKRHSVAERKFLELEFSSDLVASALISAPGLGPFKDEIESRLPDLDLASSIVETFLRAPPSKFQNKRPSLNKAIHFIANGGYGSEFRFAPATIKKQWGTHKVATPFQLAELELDFKLIGLAPDAAQWLKSTNAILKKTVKLQEYFDIAKSIQELLTSKLDPVSRQRFSFVEFPVQTESIPYEFDSFSGDQLRVYQSYKASRY